MARIAREEHKYETVDLKASSLEPFCYLTTTGRVTGRPHEIERKITRLSPNMAHDDVTVKDPHLER